MGTGSAQRKPDPYWPTIGGPIFLFLLALFCFLRPLLLLGDGGTCRHFLTGLYILAQHSIPTTTYMSAVEPSAPWVTHELFCDLLFGLPFNWLGLNFVVLSSAIAIALSFTWSYQMARFRGAGIVVSLLVLVLAIEACSLHWSARPHVFTYLFFLACYYECFISDVSLKWRCVRLFAILFFWGNTHGSFPLSIGMILLRGAGDFLQDACSPVLQAAGAVALSKRASGAVSERALEPEAERDSDLSSERDSENAKNSSSAEPILESKTNWKLKESLCILLSAALASCLNIRGASFITYVFNYLTSPKIHALSDEWRSIDFSFAAPVWSYLILACMTIAFWVYSKTKPRLGEFLYMIFLFVASLYAMRLIPYFALAALPAMASQIREMRFRESLQQLPLLSGIIQSDNRASVSELVMLKARWPLAGVAVLLSLVFLFVPSFKVKDFNPSIMPVAAVDYMKEQKIGSLGFCKDNWGSYLFWRLNEKIFIDDKTDFYSQSLINDYTSIFLTNPGWQACFAKYPFKYVLIPRGLPLEFALKDMPDWQQSYVDGTAILFTKK